MINRTRLLAYTYDALNRLSKVCDNRIAAGGPDHPEV
jgi:hypothetical protein